MSRLIFKGNTLSNTGEYLPSVYVDRIFIRDHGIAIDASVFLPHNEEYILNSLHMSSDKDEEYYSRYLKDEMKFYVAVIIGIFQEEYVTTDGTTYYSGQELYERIITDKTNIMEAEYSYGEDEGYDLTSPNTYTGRATHMVFFEIEPFASDQSPLTIFDENGQEYLKYHGTQAEIEVDNMVYSWDWDNVDSLQVIAFSSPLDIRGMSEEEALEALSDPMLTQKQTSDISYETVWENGGLASRLQVEYVDSKGAIYDQIPLQSINSLYYKIDRITHEEIVDNIESLIEEFRENYKLDEIEERRYPALRDAIDSVSTVLELKGNQVDLVPQLNAVRAAFTEKSLALPVGKFYKRLRNRLYNIDKLIRLAERLRKKIMYNGKIIDQREVATSIDINGSYLGYENCSFIYNNWLTTTSYLYDWTGDDDDWQKVVYNGYYFFDYEKALRGDSVLSRYIDVGFLENSGIHIPYDDFRVTTSYVERQSTMSYGRDVDVTLRAVMDSDVPYPVTEKMYVSEAGLENDNTVNPENAGEPYGSALSCTLLDGTWSHLMNRRFVDISTDSIDEQSGIQDYRLLAFELLDFANGVYDISNAEYTATVKATDSTMKFFRAIENMIKWIIEEYEDYLTRCEQLCSASDTTDLFNAFFSESIMEEYEDNMPNAPWIRCPLFMLFFQNLVTGQWGERQEIIDRAAIIVSQINPVNGNLTAVRRFYSDLVEIRDVLLLEIKTAFFEDFAVVGDDWYNYSHSTEWECELDIKDNSSYNDDNGVYPIETTECDDLFVEDEDTGIGTAVSDTSDSSGFRWVLMNIAETDEYGKNISSSEAKDVAKELGADGSFDGNWESRRSNGDVLNEKWWDYTGTVHPANKDDYTDASDNGIKDKLKKIDQSESGATTNHDGVTSGTGGTNYGKDWNVNLIDHFERLSSETKIDEWYEVNEAAFADFDLGTAVAVVGSPERNEYYWYRFCWWGDGNRNSGFGILEYKCYYGNDPSTQCGYPDNKITSKARADTNWDGKLYSTTFTDSDGMEKAYEDGIGVIDVERDN